MTEENKMQDNRAISNQPVDKPITTEKRNYWKIGFFLILGFIVTGLIIFVFFLISKKELFIKKQDIISNPNIQASPSVELIPVPDQQPSPLQTYKFVPPEGWVKVKSDNPNINYTFYVPNGWTYDFVCGGGGCGTVSFSKDYQSASGVQVTSGVGISVENQGDYGEYSIDNMPYTEDVNQVPRSGLWGKVNFKRELLTSNFGPVYEYVVITTPSKPQQEGQIEVPPFEQTDIWAKKDNMIYIFHMTYNKEDVNISSYKEILFNVVQSIEIIK